MAVLQGMSAVYESPYGARVMPSEGILVEFEKPQVIGIYGIPGAGRSRLLK